MVGSNACKVYYFGPRNPVELGVSVDQIVWIPLLEIKPLKNNMNNILESIAECDTVVFTSPRGPGILARTAGSNPAISKLLSQKQVVAIGEKTFDSIRGTLGVEPCCMPEKWDSRGLGELLCKANLGCVLLLRARQATPILSEKLDRCNVNYRSIDLYELVPRPDSLVELELKDYPMIISSSLIAKTIIEVIGCPKNRVVVALGRTTLNTITELCGNNVNVVMPEKPDLKKAVKLALDDGCS